MRNWFAVAWAVVLTGQSVHGTVFQSVDRALESAFPGAEVTRETIFLEESQHERAQQLAGAEIARLRVHPYVARMSGEVVGIAYFDTHRVRTLPETLMIVVEPAGVIREVRVLAFREPVDYLAPQPWYEQFPGRRLTERLRVKDGIQGVTGATLTARATSDAVRRVLAIHAILSPRWFDGASTP